MKSTLKFENGEKPKEIGNGDDVFIDKSVTFSSIFLN